MLSRDNLDGRRGGGDAPVLSARVAIQFGFEPSSHGYIVISKGDGRELSRKRFDLYTEGVKHATELAEGVETALSDLPPGSRVFRTASTPSFGDDIEEAIKRSNITQTDEQTLRSKLVDSENNVGYVADWEWYMLGDGKAFATIIPSSSSPRCGIGLIIVRSDGRYYKVEPLKVAPDIETARFEAKVWLAQIFMMYQQWKESMGSWNDPE